MKVYEKEPEPSCELPPENCGCVSVAQVPAYLNASSSTWRTTPAFDMSGYQASKHGMGDVVSFVHDVVQIRGSRATVLMVGDHHRSSEQRHPYQKEAVVMCTLPGEALYPPAWARTRIRLSPGRIVVVVKLIFFIREIRPRTARCTAQGRVSVYASKGWGSTYQQHIISTVGLLLICSATRATSNATNLMRTSYVALLLCSCRG